MPYCELYYPKMSFLHSDMIPARLNIGILAFLITFISYALRSNVALSILAMVQPTHANATVPDVSATLFAAAAVNLIFI